jgi:hypothetical protein
VRTLNAKLETFAVNADHVLTFSFKCTKFVLNRWDCQDHVVSDHNNVVFQRPLYWSEMLNSSQNALVMRLLKCV